MSYSNKLASRIQRYLMDVDMKGVTFDSDKGVFRFGMNISGKLKSVNYYILVHDDDYTVYAVSPLSAEDCKLEMAEFVCRANYGLRNGNFELDMRDGEVRYKAYHDCDGGMPSDAAINTSLRVCARMFERYGDGIAAIMFGMKTPEDAVNDCEK